MTRQEVYDEGHLRRYLLGELNEEEQQAVEEKLLEDDGLFDSVLAAEDELIDEYVDGALSPGERESFEGLFLSVPERQRKLSFAMALRRYVTTEDEAATAEASAKASVFEPRRGTDARAPRARVIEHPARRAASPSVWWKQAFSSPYLRMAGAAVIVIGLGLFIWRVFFYESEVEKGMSALAKAYRTERTVEARITGLGYAPMNITRGAEQSKIDELQLDLAERILLQEVTEHPSPASHHALGRFYLAARKFDKAIAQFDEALKGDRNNAQLHSDYGAALLEMGKADRLSDDSGKRLEELAKSLEQLNKALELNGSLLEALFNRALAYQQMMLPGQAEEDWHSYIEKDPTSDWANEARQYLKELEDQKNKVVQNPDRLFQEFIEAYNAKDDEKAWEVFSRTRVGTGNSITNRLLNTYLKFEAGGLTDEGTGQLQILLYAGNIERQRIGDLFTLDLTSLYREATPARQAVMSQARSLMQSGNELFLRSKIREARDAYDAARSTFAREGDNAEAEHAEYRLGHCYLRQPDIAKSLSVLEKLAQSCKRNSHYWLLARTLNAIADAHFSLNDYSTGLDHTIESLNISQRIEDSDSTLRNFAQLASEYYLLNDYQKSVGFVQRGLSTASASCAEPAQFQLLYSIAASDFTQMDLFSAALAYEGAALKIAAEMNATLLQSRGYSQLGLIYARMKNYEEALRNTKLSYELGADLSDTTAGKEMMAYASLRLGNIFRQSDDISRAIASYDQQIEICDKLKFPAEGYKAHKGKLLCNIAQGDDASAQNELQTTLSFFDQYRSSISEESNRNTFFDAEQDIYDIAVDFAYSRMNDARKAFEYSELSLARSLLDLTSASAMIINRTSTPEVRVSSVLQPLCLVDIQERMPDQAQILQYTALSNRLLIFFVSKTAFRCAEENISQEALKEKVLRYWQLVSQPSYREVEAEKQATELYDLLIGPVSAHLDKNKYLCIVPDKFLHYIPFSTLISSSSNRYLVCDYVIGSAPSSTLFVKCTDVARSKSGAREERLLSVGNPLFDRVTFPTLQDLPSSAIEAETIASFYHSSLALVGSRARESRVRREMLVSDVIHLGMHYVGDKYSSVLSKFLLTKEDPQLNQDWRTDGFLQAFEIYAMKLPRARLVVLSACQTGIERTYRGEGAISVARPFISAGVPVVVASLWQIDSDSSAELMINLHKQRKRNGLSTAEALRAAQLEMANNSARRFHQPYYWAPFAVIGGYAIF
jgi:CHAT domain-containing protein